MTKGPFQDALGGVTVSPQQIRELVSVLKQTPIVTLAGLGGAYEFLEALAEDGGLT